jgi:hypothetical protein
MKLPLALVSLWLGAMGVQAQGYLNWNAQANWSISFYSPSSIPAVVETGNSASDIPAGTTVYSGGWIGGTATSPGPGVGPTPNFGPGAINYQDGSAFEVGLYLDTSVAAVQSDMDTDSPLATTTINDGGIGFIAREAESPLAAGTEVNVGLAAWYNGSGTVSSYAAAVAAGDPGGYNISTGQLALGSLTGTPVTISPGIGLTSFALSGLDIPEPSTNALVVTGLAAFLMRTRRKRPASFN